MRKIRPSKQARQKGAHRALGLEVPFLTLAVVQPDSHPGALVWKEARAARVLGLQLCLVSESGAAPQHPASPGLDFPVCMASFSAAPGAYSSKDQSHQGSPKERIPERPRSHGRQGHAGTVPRIVYELVKRIYQSPPLVACEDLWRESGACFLGECGDGGLDCLAWDLRSGGCRGLLEAWDPGPSLNSSC